MATYNSLSYQTERQYRQVLKAVDVGEWVNAWNLILRPDKQSFAT